MCMYAYVWSMCCTAPESLQLKAQRMENYPERKQRGHNTRAYWKRSSCYCVKTVDTCNQRCTLKQHITYNKQTRVTKYMVTDWHCVLKVKSLICFFCRLKTYISTWSDDILNCVTKKVLMLRFRNLAILSSGDHACSDMSVHSCIVTQNRNVPLL